MSDEAHPRSSTEEPAADEATPEPASAADGKKKRTRTLTTPYQSAVLHSLLAQVTRPSSRFRPCADAISVPQSRFPTTQMREDVGRTIGLSARKVQVRHPVTCASRF
jgi:hypothetical protein